jgi:hypothetical protein
MLHVIFIAYESVIACRKMKLFLRLDESAIKKSVIKRYTKCRTYLYLFVKQFLYNILLCNTSQVF